MIFEAKEPQTLEVAFEGDRMTTQASVDEAAPGCRDSRCGRHRRRLEYEHSTGVPAYERYGADGRMEFRIPMPGETNGTWSLAESTLSMETQGKESRCSVHREGDLLSMTPMGTEGNRTRTYRLTARWYPFPMSTADEARLAEKLGISAPRTEK